MKSSTANRGAPYGIPVPSSTALSHIPLPRRKNSCKGDKDVDDTDSEYGGDVVLTRSHAKMSILGSTSFCCTSGQKEDYIPDSKLVPATRPPKKRPPNVQNKKDPAGSEPSTPKSPLLNAGRALLSRGKKGKINSQESDEAHVQVNGYGSPKTSAEDARSRPATIINGDSRLRPLEDRRKIPPSSPQRRIHKDSAAIPKKDYLDGRKYLDPPRHLRKDSEANACKPPDFTCDKKPADSVDGLSVKSFEWPRQKIGSGDSSLIDNGPNTIRDEPLCSAMQVGFSPVDHADGSAIPQVGHKPHDNEDFDCPCCDRPSVLMDDAGLSDIEVKMLTSCDVLSADEALPNEKSDMDVCDNMENVLQSEIDSLKVSLEAGRKELQNHQDRVRHLEEELSLMKQLQGELDKEKELRKIAEDKLLELLDYEKRMEEQKKENEKQMESKCTQMDVTEALQDLTENGSPMLLGYDGRLRKYQAYIAKLEKDNLMLVNELKKFKDMSPRSQEEQAKILMEKIGLMERNNFQQQIQYETCLDDVANKLVQTVLAHKRLEEECKILHLRVEQLEQENGTLKEIIEDDTTIEKETVKVATTPSLNGGCHPKKPFHHLTSSPIKKNNCQKLAKSFDDRKKESLKSTNTSPIKSPCSESSSLNSPASPVPKTGCASKIPSFGIPKPLMTRKKSDIDMPSTKHKRELPTKEVMASDFVPNSRCYSALPSTRSKLPSSSKNSKGVNAKRKRLSRNASPVDKGTKDLKQRIKSNQIQWEPQRPSPVDATSPCKSKECLNQISPIPVFPQPQQVWSFNCVVNTDQAVPEIKRKVSDSIDILNDSLCCSLDLNLGRSESFNDKQNSSASESSAVMEGGNRTRDEGYSTMSSDLQPDSAADTTISEPEHSATFVITEKDESDDSVTECLDGSMCSSSDSGFGPLHQVQMVSNLPSDFPINTEMNKTNELPKFDASSRRNGTIRSKEQIASVKPTVRNPSNVCDNSTAEIHCDTYIPTASKIKTFLAHSATSPIESAKLFQDGRLSPMSLKEKLYQSIDPSTMVDYWSFPKEIMELNQRKSWHLGPTRSAYDDPIVFCSRHSYIDDNLFEEKIETAEKATLTEPEEELWREKALAPFIDESIWSLCSSEGDIQIKHFPLEPLLSEPSLENLIANCSPCIIVTQDIASNPEMEHSEEALPLSKKSPTNSPIQDRAANSTDRFKVGLERVASDTVLYVKEAVHELEDSMRKGLKSSKNISALHQNSGSDSEDSPSSGLCFKPQLFQTLEATMSRQNNLPWPSPTRSSSTSSLQSSQSCHVISDEMEDVDVLRTSRKGSQDPDLSSASDAEYENLEHKDFVERWLQKEIPCGTSSKMVPQLETVSEIGEFSSSLLLKKTSNIPETIPATSIAPANSSSNMFEENYFSSNTDYCEEAYVECLDSEAKEFNEDFYTLCSIGSLKSLDRCSPARTRDVMIKQFVESPIVIRKFSPSKLPKVLPQKSEKLKPTGLVKPTRPVTLAVSSVPKVPERATKIQNSEVPLTTSIPKSSIENIDRKTDITKINNRSKVPLDNVSINQNGMNTTDSLSTSKSSGMEFSLKDKPSLPCLPTPTTPVKNRAVAVKTKSPTKFVVKNGNQSRCEESSRRHQIKRDRAAKQNRLKEGCGTAWVHLQANPGLNDPSVRNSFLDAMKAPSSSSGSSSSEDEDNEVLVIQTNTHLHKICKDRRHKAKASANNPLFDIRKRSSIISRRDLFYRFGDKEKEAIACFDFLETIPSSSLETLTKKKQESSPPNELKPPSSLDLNCPKRSSTKERIPLLSPTVSESSKNAEEVDPPPKRIDIAKSPFSNYSARKLRLPNLWNKPLSHNLSSSTLNSQDYEILDHISLSDSCAESYSSTPDSYDDAS